MADYWDRISAERERLKVLLEEAQAELVNRLRQREELEEEIYALQRDIKKLSALCGVTVEEPAKQLGITDSIRYILANQKRPMTPVEVKQALEEDADFDSSAYKNPLSMVHTILKRLVRSEEARAKTDNESKTVVFSWTGGPAPYPPMPDYVKDDIKRDREHEE